VNIVALIPARAGSKRIPGKNTKLLGGKPLIQWTIEAARQAGIFSEIVVSSDCRSAIDIALSTGATMSHWRKPDHATDAAPDIWWVKDALHPMTADAFAILRPTSPFRTADTIRRALAVYLETPTRALRAMEPVKQHPGKMWEIIDHSNAINPFKPFAAAALMDDDGEAPRHWRGPLDGIPYHSSPTQTLPRYYIQNANLEIAPVSLVLKDGVIAGDFVTPFFTEGWEGFDINTPDDWDRAEAHAATLLAPVSSPSSEQR